MGGWPCAEEVAGTDVEGAGPPALGALMGTPAVPLVQTKLHLPRTRAGAVPRRRLLEHLDRGATARLTLVSAPAGFGKTTLLGQWLATRPKTATGGLPVAWLSLDAEDNDPRAFWTYLIAALRTVAPEVGAAELALLQGSDTPPVKRVLTTVLNDLGARPDDVVLILDDYHLIESNQLHEELAFLLDHLPAQLHVVIASRTDPALPLARLRARGELVEVRATELRFTADEAADYLNGAMGLTLTTTEIGALGERTEGWIAALQLAALSMQGRDDVGGFIAGFTGDDRYIVDYLVEEVLQRQPDRLRTFLLQTSILDRLTGSLCEAVTGQDHGKATLELLDRGNLFVVPLDDQRRWYRYHHLFGDVLRARLLDEHPDQVLALHRSASTWYEEHGDRAAAIRHALAAPDFDRAANLVEREFAATRRHRRESTLLGWLEKLPDAVIQDRPVLSVVFAGTLLSTGTVDGVEQRLRDAERWLSTPEHERAAAGMVVADEAELHRLPAWVANYRAAQALLEDDPVSTLTYAQRALELVAPGDDIERAAASALVGLASWHQGDLEAAHEAYTTSSQIFLQAGYFSDVLGCAVILGDLRVTQGRLHDAMATYQTALRQTGHDLDDIRGGSALRGAADMLVAMSMMHREHGDLAAARRCLEVGEELGEHLGLPQNRYRWRVAMARLHQAHGELEAAAGLLDQAEQAYVSDFIPDVRPVSALRAQILVAQGRLGEATTWGQRHRLSHDDELSYRHELEHLTLARILLARSTAERSQEPLRQATGLLERLLGAAEAGGRIGSVIEILLLRALAHHVDGQAPAALASLQRALSLAEPEGYARLFLDEGSAMVALLAAAAEEGIAPAYVRTLLQAVTEAPSGAGRARTAAATGRMVEPLSDRERDVLRLLATDLTGPEIARELVVSLNTVRTHTRNVYLKLGVSGRRAAVRRAEELDLLSRRRTP